MISLEDQIECYPEEYEVELILQESIQNAERIFLVKWLGYPPSQSTWEPLSHLANAKDKIREWEKAQRLSVAKKKKIADAQFKLKLHEELTLEDQALIQDPKKTKAIRKYQMRDRTKAKKQKLRVFEERLKSKPKVWESYAGVVDNNLQDLQGKQDQIITEAFNNQKQEQEKSFNPPQSQGVNVNKILVKAFQPAHLLNFKKKKGKLIKMMAKHIPAIDQKASLISQQAMNDPEPKPELVEENEMISNVSMEVNANSIMKCDDFEQLMPIAPPQSQMARSIPLQPQAINFLQQLYQHGSSSDRSQSESNASAIKEGPEIEVDSIDPYFIEQYRLFVEQKAKERAQLQQLQELEEERFEVIEQSSSQSEDSLEIAPPTATKIHRQQSQNNHFMQSPLSLELKVGLNEQFDRISLRQHERDD